MGLGDAIKAGGEVVDVLRLAAAIGLGVLRRHQRGEISDDELRQYVGREESHASEALERVIAEGKAKLGG